MRIALLTCLLLAACTVGEVGTANNTGSDGGTDGSANANGCADRLTPAGAAHTHTAPVVAGNPSNMGQNCIVAACHLNNNLGPNAPGYQFAGTLYAAGTTNPQAGAQVRIKSGAMTLTTYTDTDGNFSFPAGSLAGQFSAMTDVSACPTITNMVTPLVGGNGGGAGANSCNLCHTTGAGAQAPPISL
jgi:hypothetical protein